MRLRTAHGVVVLSLLGACGGSSAPAPAATASELPTGAAARVGTGLISTATVSRIASAQGLSPTRALNHALSDELFAQAARSSSRPGLVAQIERAALAHGVLEQLRIEATRGGPATEAEVAEVAQERWLDVDRPDAARTIHALVVNDKPEKAGAAQSAAEKLLEAVKPATSAEEFAQLAKAVPLDGFELKVESLPLVTSDGRAFDRRDGGFVARGTFDADFARAAGALTTPGQLSPVTRSRFGFHVIRLEERLAGHVVPRSELAQQLGTEVLTRRAARARRELLERLRKARIIEVDRGVDELTARPKVTP
jgi:peptidyl-prolyl cis-trans isomerase C